MHRLKTACALLVPVAVIFLSGCDLINPAEELPAYISIQEPQVVIDEATGFATKAGIRNVWLYHAGFLQGAYQTDPEAFPLGRVVPVLDLKRSDYFMEGGIYESGQSSFQIPYPFWDRVTFDWQATAGDTHVVTPSFHYVDPGLYITSLDEHFDGGSIDFVPFSSGLPSDSSAFFDLRSTDVFHGTGIGYVDFTAQRRYFETINSTPFQTTQSSNIFAEITYKNTIPFSVGLIYQSISGVLRQDVLTVSPNGNWNTVYVHLITEVRAIINANGPATLFWLWIRADGGGDEGYIKFDDIRVIREN